MCLGHPPPQAMATLLKQVKLLEKTIAQKTEAEAANLRLMADLSVLRENKSREAPRPRPPPLHYPCSGGRAACGVGGKWLCVPGIPCLILLMAPRRLIRTSEPAV